MWWFRYMQLNQKQISRQSEPEAYTDLCHMTFYTWRTLAHTEQGLPLKLTTVHVAPAGLAWLRTDMPRMARVSTYALAVGGAHDSAGVCTVFTETSPNQTRGNCLRSVFCSKFLNRNVLQSECCHPKFLCQTRSWPEQVSQGLDASRSREGIWGYCLYLIDV